MNRATILVVEDSPASMKLIVDLLTIDGFRALPANSGELALAAIAVNRPDLVLLDLLMPGGMDGIEVLRRLKAHEATRDIPVIILSGVTEMELRVECYELGAVDFVSKPFQHQELLTRVQVRMQLHAATELLRRQAAELTETNTHLQVEIAERRLVEEDLRLAKAAAEEGLLQERQLMVAIVESSMDAIVGESHDNIVTSWNRGAEKVFGYSAGEIVGQSALTLIPPELREEHQRAIGIIWRGESVERIETERLHRSGSRIDVAFTISPIRDKADRILGASTITVDITERKRQGREIMEQHALLTRQKAELEQILSRIKRLEGIIPICMYCKKIRTERDDWQQLERYISQHSDAFFSHGLCPECATREMKKLD